MDLLGESFEVREVAEPVEQARRLDRERKLDVGGGQRVADE